MLLIVTCKHDPIIPDITEGGTNPIDTTGNNPADGSCDPDSVYFENDILPIFQANCAFAPCHTNENHESGLGLSNYREIMEDIEPFDLNGSKIFRDINLGINDEDLMPRIVGTQMGEKLDQAKIDLIQTWILQGAKNNKCDACDTSNVSFANDLIPILERSCNTGSSCHGASSGRPIWDDYQTVKNNISKFQVRVIDRTSAPMPPSGPLPNCEIDKLKAWIENGASDN